MNNLPNQQVMHEHRPLTSLFIDLPGYRVCDCTVYWTSPVQYQQVT